MSFLNKQQLDSSLQPQNGQHIATIVARTEINSEHFRLRLYVPSIARSAAAGQFIHILTRQQVSFDPLLRRAFSIAAIDGAEIEIVFRIEGRGTKLLSQYRVGDQIDVLGPLGKPFAPVMQYNILVGGGVGVPPLAMLASQASKNGSMDAIIGARSEDYIVCREDLERYCNQVLIATDDGSAGVKGLVTDLLDPLLSGKDKATRSQTHVYSCGPLPMLRAVAHMCAQHEVLCQISLEENMPCGVGVCNGCVVPVLEADDEYGTYRRVCVDGPVMWATDIAW